MHSGRLVFTEKSCFKCKSAIHILSGIANANAIKPGSRQTTSDERENRLSKKAHTSYYFSATCKHAKYIMH